MPRGTPDPLVKARVLEMLEEGKSPKEINAATGTKISTISFWKKGGKKPSRSTKKTPLSNISVERLQHEISMLRLENNHLRKQLDVSDPEDRKRNEIEFLKEKLKIYEDQLDPLPHDL